MANDLWELELEVKDAADLVRRALDRTSEALTDQHTGEPLPWKEMGETQLRLMRALDILESALEPIADAVKAEREYMDEMSDKADGQSY